MQIQIDGSACQGHGLCYELAPLLIEADEDGHGRVVQADVPEGLADSARHAASNCPEWAIDLTESGQ